MRMQNMKRQIKRLAAAGLAACMVLTLPATALAESASAPITVSQETEKEPAVWSSQRSESGETENPTQNAGAEAPDEIPESTELEEVQDNRATSDTEKTTERAADGTGVYQQPAQAASEAANTVNQSPSLTLAEAAALSDKLKVKDTTIEVTDGEGLILLSNVKPKEYCSGYTISLITNVGWDVTQTVTLSGTALSVSGTW